MPPRSLGIAGEKEANPQLELEALTREFEQRREALATQIANETARLRASRAEKPAVQPQVLNIQQTAPNIPLPSRSAQQPITLPSRGLSGQIAGAGQGGSILNAVSQFSDLLKTQTGQKLINPIKRALFPASQPALEPLSLSNAPDEFISQLPKGLSPGSIEGILAAGSVPAPFTPGGPTGFISILPEGVAPGTAQAAALQAEAAALEAGAAGAGAATAGAGALPAAGSLNLAAGAPSALGPVGGATSGTGIAGTFGTVVGPALVGGTILAGLLKKGKKGEAATEQMNKFFSAISKNPITEINGARGHKFNLQGQTFLARADAPSDIFYNPGDKKLYQMDFLKGGLSPIEISVSTQDRGHGDEGGMVVEGRPRVVSNYQRSSSGVLQSATGISGATRFDNFIRQLGLEPESVFQVREIRRLQDQLEFDRRHPFGTPPATGFLSDISQADFDALQRQSRERERGGGGDR